MMIYVCRYILQPAIGWRATAFVAILRLT